MGKTSLFENQDGCKAAPKDLAPNLYGTTRFKRRFISTELTNSNWIRILQDIQTTSQLEEFILLFMALTPVSLSGQDDSIAWRWTANRCYSVSSAYECQLLGATIGFPATDIWRTKTEQKCKFFTWLVLHDRVLTTDNLIKRNWPCNQLCPLCHYLDETTTIFSHYATSLKLYGTTLPRVLIYLTSRCYQLKVIELRGITDRLGLTLLRF
jgi:hypothetical protein